MRKLITEADPDVVEEWKWMNPVWAHDGIICTGESYKKAVKLIRPVSSTRASTETYAARSTSTKEKQSTRPPSRRWFAKRSRSTVLATRNLQRRRSDAAWLKIKPCSEVCCGALSSTRRRQDRKSTRLNSSHSQISYAV